MPGQARTALGLALSGHLHLQPHPWIGQVVTVGGAQPELACRPVAAADFGAGQHAADVIALAPGGRTAALSSSRSRLSFAGIRRTEPSSLVAGRTRKLLSRSIEPKRACLILSTVLASCVTARVLRKLACSTDKSWRCAAAPANPCQNSVRTAGTAQAPSATPAPARAARGSGPAPRR
jgi:hypothetical protein